MIEWNKVTWYSTALSVVFFVFVLPALVFYIGIRYREVTATYEESQEIIKASIQNLSIHKSEEGAVSATSTSTSTDEVTP